MNPGPLWTRNTSPLMNWWFESGVLNKRDVQKYQPLGKQMMVTSSIQAMMVT